MSELKPCPVTQIQAYRAYEKLLEIMEDETDDQTEAFSAAYKALYWIANDYRAQPANEPLTLDEMNALDHDPIYVLHTGGKWTMNGWHIATASSYQNHGRCDLEIDNGNTTIDMQNYGKTWLAYRRKPEGSENG